MVYQRFIKYSLPIFTVGFILAWTPLKATASANTINNILNNHLEEIKNHLPSGLQMRLPSSIPVKNLPDDKNKKYFVRVFPLASVPSFTVSIFNCDTEESSCLVGSFSVDSKNSSTAQEAFKKHQSAAAPITIKDGIQAYFLDGSKQKEVSQFSSIIWEQDGLLYTIQFPVQERQNIFFMAYSMANGKPILSALAPTQLESKVNEPILTSPPSSTNATVHNERVDKNVATSVTNDYLLLNLSKRRVYVYKNGKVQVSYPVAIGKKGWETPTGTFTVINMDKNPGWINPFTNEKVPPGPKNPLGVAWIGFFISDGSEIGFHGTPGEELIGQAVSHGCVRMRNQDVIKLYEQVEIGMKVKVVP